MDSVTKSNLIYNSSEWKPITFTHVEYPKGKMISMQTEIK